MAARFSVGGEWSGHFVDPNSVREKEGPVFGITAILVETKGSIDGSMIDLETDYEVPYRRYIEAMRPADHQRCTEFARRFKDVTVRLGLPGRARIVGRNSGTQVEFIKTYDGPQTVIWLSEGKEIAKETIPNPKIFYSGAFDKGGAVLDGTWSIRQPGLLGLLGKRIGDGSFHLVRQTL